MNNILLTIIFREGSKRLPNKATLDMNGLALWEHTLNQALKTRFSDIIISTDVPEVLNNEELDIPVFKRPEKHAQDDSSKFDAIIEALDASEGFYNKFFDYVIDLDITNPLRTPYDIETAFRVFKCSTNNVLFSVTKAFKNPYFNQVQVNEETGISYVTLPITNKTRVFVRTQDAPLVYDINCNIYIYKRDWLEQRRGLETHIVEHSNPCIFIMEDWKFCDIDTELHYTIVKNLQETYKNELKHKVYEDIS